MAAVKEFSKALVLTTPHEVSQRVKDAQFLMAGHSRFGKGLSTYKDGKVDGDYGPLAEQATERTKFWLGYPESACTGDFGQTLYEYLRKPHWRPLPKAYQKRRANRLAAITPGQKAIELAATFIGYHESPPGSNMNQFGSWYGFNGVPWCAIFESYCFAHTGHAGYRYAAVEQIVLDARARRNKLYVVQTPKQGDIVCYTIAGNPYAHTAFFDKWVNKSKGQFQDLGGNTGPSNVSNGGAVMRQVRSTSMVTCFVRVSA